MNCLSRYLLLLALTICLQIRLVRAANDPPEGALHFYNMSFPQAALIDPNTIHIPFKLVGRLITVEARIDTLTGAFLLDTGAERLLLNKNYFRGRGRPNVVAAMGNTGRVEAIRRRKVDSLQWDALFFYDLHANVLDLSHIEGKKKIRLLGILGYEVFKDFELFLDFQLQQLILTRLDKQGFRIDADAIWETPYDSLDFQLRRHLIVLEGKVGGKSLKLGLDSGAEVNLLDRLVKRKVLDHFEITKRVKMLGVGRQTAEVLAGSLRNVQCGNQHTESMRTLLTNLDDMTDAFGIRLDGVLGYEFLSSRRTLINYKRKKLFFFYNQRP